VTLTAANLLAASPYQAYAYAYPHKTAYRRLPAPVGLRELWAEEDSSALFLYLHVPFCEFRCGFCNLFTQSQPGQGLVTRYLSALSREAEHVRAALGPEPRFARFALGGGTPTQLGVSELSALLDLAASWGIDLASTPTSIESSPDTVDAEKLALLAERGVDRISLGVQSFVDDEARAAGRPQRTDQVERALGMIQSAGFPVLNVDLIYGLPGQTPRSWRHSLERALAYAPEELFLYPLYVRPLTGLARRDRTWDDERLTLYRLGREILLSAGYEQVSMRLFRAPDAEPEAPAYCCQEDGMIGLGCGARSYTRGLHYSSEYAVGQRGVREILSDYVDRSDAEFASARYGFALDADERRRRFVIQSLLWKEGLDLAHYRRRFGSEALRDLPQLAELRPQGLAALDGEQLTLTPLGLERSDALGPWLTSSRVHTLTEAYELR